MLIGGNEWRQRATMRSFGTDFFFSQRLGVRCADKPCTRRHEGARSTIVDPNTFCKPSHPRARRRMQNSKCAGSKQGSGEVELGVSESRRGDLKLGGLDVGGRVGVTPSDDCSVRAVVRVLNK